MNEKYDHHQIFQYWKEQAQKHGTSPSASWSDHSVIHLEIKEIVKRIEHGDQVLDVGCANGYSTVQFSRLRRIHITGIDFVPEMIENARSRLTEEKGLLSKVTFEVGNIQALEKPSDHYDKVVVIRVLINQREPAQQVKAARECARVLKKGGLLLLSEASVQGWQRLNQFRREWGLTDIPVPPFNHYIDEEMLVRLLPRELELMEIVNFASTYYVGTRVFKPLFAKLLDKEADIANPDMEWNRFFAQLPNAGDYGVQKLFVLRKN